MKKILLVGSSGLVGQSVLALALADNRVSQVVALTRTALPEHPKLLNPLVNFDSLAEDEAWWAVNAVICTLGTTIKKTGSPTAFHHVDFNYPLKVAELSLRHGATAYVLNSAAGANPNSRIFYSKTKGQLELAISKLNYPSLTIVRPSLIGGNRDEFRLGEKIFLILFKLLRPLIPRRYHIVNADKIAASLFNAAINPQSGMLIIESENI